MKTFYVKVLQGLIPQESIQDQFDDEVQAWHEGSSNQSLHEYLGLPESVYNKIVQSPSELNNLYAKKDLNAQELCAILKTLPPEAKVCYDSVHSFSAEDIHFDEDFKHIVLNY